MMSVFYENSTACLPRIGGWAVSTMRSSASVRRDSTPKQRTAYRNPD